MDTLILGLRRHISPTRIQYWAQVWLAEEEDFKGILQHAAVSKKDVKVIKLPFIYVFVGGKGLSVLGSVKLRIVVFFFRYPWADPDLWQEYFVLLKNTLTLPMGQKNKTKQKKIKEKKEKKTS